MDISGDCNIYIRSITANNEKHTVAILFNPTKHLTDANEERTNEKLIETLKK